jgi:signal transduction histidine kinase/GAF domain-containing protein
MEAMEAKIHTVDESAIFERIARIVSSVRGAKSDYTCLAAELEQAVPFDIFGVVLLQHDGQAVRVTICEHEADGSWKAAYHRHPFADSKMEHMSHDQVLVVQDYPDGLDGPPAECGDALSRFPQLRSTLIVPLIVGDHLLGTLELGSMAPRMYTHEARQRLMDAVARVLATAIEGVQLGGNTAIQDKQREVLKDVTSALTEKMDLPTILNRIVVGISEALNVSSCIILRDEVERCLHLEAQAGLNQGALESVFGSGLPVSDKCIFGQTVLRRQPLASNNLAEDDRFPDSCISLSKLGLRSIVSHPLATGTTVYGVLCLCSTEPGGFTPLKTDIFALFANQATIAIHNGILLESAQQRSRFQLAVEQLERVRQQPIEMAFSEDDTENEPALLAQVRDRVQHTFGISFASFLRFISNHLLIQDERNGEAAISCEECELTIDQMDALRMDADGWDREPILRLTDTLSGSASKASFIETLSLLAQTAESALTRAGMVGQLGRLLGQLKDADAGVKDAWFVVNLDGICVYMNPAAEAFCEMQLESLTAGYGSRGLISSPQRQIPSLMIEDVFINLLPRMRNADEVYKYLRDFTQESAYRQELRCVLATTQSRERKEIDVYSSQRQSIIPTDYHYQFVRYPLYDEHEQLAAHALQVQDITQQVHDERNRAALLSSVSHDLRTPLTTIKAAVTGLLQKEIAWSAEDQQDMLEDINREADQLTVLINSLVELSRIEMGALMLEKEWCDITEILYGALAKLDRTLKGRVVHPKVVAPLPLVYADHVQLEHVFYNLVENAARHSPQDTDIDVIMEAVGEAAMALRIQIIDYGDRIPEQEYERIFKTLYSPRSQSYSNGMGLAICKGIVEAHQGQIWLDSTIKEGTCFTLLLPIHPHIVPIRGATFPVRKDVYESKGQTYSSG